MLGQGGWLIWVVATSSRLVIFGRSSVNGVSEYASCVTMHARKFDLRLVKMLAVVQKQKTSFISKNAENARMFGYDETPQYLNAVRSAVVESKQQIAKGCYVSSLGEFHSIMEKKNPRVWK